MWTPSLQVAFALDRLLSLNLLARKDFGLVCEVLAAINVESSQIKEVSKIAISARRIICVIMIFGKYRVIKVSEEAVKSPVRWKCNGNIKSVVMGNEKVVVEKVDKVRIHGNAFTFHNNIGTAHGMV